MCPRPSQPDTTIEFGDTTLTVEEAAIVELLDVSPSDVTAPETAHRREERLSPVDDGVPVHLYLLLVLRPAR